MYKKYIRNINKVTAGAPLFYITNDAQRAVGVEDILENYFILDGSNNYTAKVLLENYFNIYSTNNVPNTSLNLIKQELIKQYIKKHSRETANLIFFKVSKTIEKAAFGFNILSADATLSSKLENKIYCYELLKETGFSPFLPKAVLKRISEADYKGISGFLGKSFVVQFDIGHSGNSTFFINYEDEFDLFKEKYNDTNILCRFTEKLHKKYITINAVSTKYGTYSAGLCDQLTGLKEINANEGESCGNNWNQLNINKKTREECIKLTERIGKYLYSIGYKGLFGIDFSVTNGKLYIIEINARQTTSIQDLNKIQIEEGFLPLSIINIMEFLNIDFDINNEEYSKLNNNPLEASSIIIRNHAGKKIHILKSYNGIYDIEKIEKNHDGYSIADVYSISKVLILEANQNEVIEEYKDYLKIVTKGNIIGSDGSLDKNIHKIITTINKDIK